MAASMFKNIKLRPVYETVFKRLLSSNTWYPLSRNVPKRKTNFLIIFQHNFEVFPSPILQCVQLSNVRSVSTSSCYWCEETGGEEEVLVRPTTDKKPEELSEEEISEAIEYLESSDYQELYGNKPTFWYGYKRNFKGQVPPAKTRQRCVRGNGEKRKVCGHPCPICRDEKLIIHFKNVKLLEQFICPDTLEIYSYHVTGICQRKYKQLSAEVNKARDHGLLPFFVPLRKYNYRDYYEPEVAERLAGGSR